MGQKKINNNLNKKPYTSTQPNSNKSDSIENSMLFGVENQDRKRLAKRLIDGEMRKLSEVAKLLDGYDLLGGDIVHLSFDCPKNLRRYFNQVARRKYGSTCRGLRKFMLIECVEDILKKHALGNTLSDVVPSVFNVPQIVMPTYVQSRVRRYVRNEAISGVNEYFVNQFGIWCILKQSRFRHVRDLPCFFWKSCKCGNVNCWSKVRQLILKSKGHNENCRL